MNSISSEEPWVAIFRAPDEWQAEMARVTLLEEGIPAMIQSAMMPSFSELTILQEGGWGDVLVPPDLEARAREILERQQAASEEPEPDGE